MSCVTTPSATETHLVTLTSQSVSNSPSVTTLPDSTSTTIFTTCALTATASDSSAPGPTCLVTRTVTSTAVLPGGEVTTQVPFTVDVPFTSTSFSTLFGTSCTSQPVSDPPRPQPPTTASPTPPTSISISTPPPETFTSQSESTLPNGVVTTTLLTVVSTLPPTSIVVSTTMPGQSQQQDNPNDDNSANLGPIIGGTVGGFFGLIGIVAVVWFIMKRRSRWDDIFDKEEETLQETTRASGNRFSLDVDNEPKPYQYGLVGHVTSPQLHSPPNSPPFGPVIGGSVHNRRPSSTGIPAPLSLSPSFTTSAGHSAQNTATNMTALSSRPSSAGSMQPLFTAGQQQGRMTNEFGTRPPSIHSHSHSSSITSPPTTFANWGNNVNITGTGSFMGPAAAAGGVAAVAAMAADEPRRSGSPVSVNDPPRRLQLVNATPASAASSIYSPDNEHRRGLSNDSLMSNNRAGPSSHANVAEFDPYASTSIDTPLAQGVTRTNTKGMVILDPPSREVRVATDGGRLAVVGGSSSAAGPSSSYQAASSSSSSAPPPKAQPQQQPSNPPPAYEE